MSQKSDRAVDWSKLIIAAAALLLLTIVLGQAGAGYAMGSYQYGGSYYPGLSASNLMVSLLYALIKLLWLLLLIIVLVALFVALKKYILDSKTLDINPLIEKITGSQYKCPVCQEKLDQEFKFCPKCKTGLQNSCVNCGKSLIPAWTCCPVCGTEKNKGGSDS